MSRKFIISEQDRKHIRGLYEQSQPNQQPKRLVTTSYGTADFTNIPNDKIQGMVDSYVNLVNRAISGEDVGAIMDYSIMQKFPEQFNPFKFLNANTQDNNLVEVFMAIKLFCLGGGNSDLGKLGITKPKFTDPISSTFSKPMELGDLIDWYSDPKNKYIIEEFIGTYNFVFENGNIFKNTRAPQVKTIVPQDFLNAYREVQADEFSISGYSAFFGKEGKGYLYSKTDNGYVLKKYDR